MVIKKGAFSLEGPKEAPISHKENIFKILFVIKRTNRNDPFHNLLLIILGEKDLRLSRISE